MLTIDWSSDRDGFSDALLFLVVAHSLEDLHHEHDNALIHRTVLKSRCQAKRNDNLGYRTGRTSKE